MTFLNGAILAALTLGLLPILIHLLNRQRFKKVDFPTLRFLRELQRQKMRQVRIRQIVLLILRTLAVLFIVLAVARPVVKTSADFLPGADARTTAVLILDRSASMQTETPNGIRFRQVQTRAQEILNSLKEGDEAILIWADERPIRFPESPTGHLRNIRETIAGAIPHYGGGNLVEALKAARAVLGQSQNLHKEVYILSDFSLSAWPEKMPQADLLPKDVRIFTLPCEKTSPRNVGITGASVTSRIITPGRPVEVSFTIRNTGEAAASDRIVSIYSSGRRVAQTRVTLAIGESKQLRLKFVPDTPGDQVGYVRLEEPDDFPLDDVRFFVLRVPTRLRVAVAGVEGASRDLTALALNPSGEPNSFVEVRRETIAQLEAEDWSQLDAIMIVDGAGFSQAFPGRLRDFIDRGRGAFIVLGPHADLRAHQTWLPTLGLPALGDLWQNAESPARWRETDLAHPLFEGLFEEKPTGISPQIFRMISVAKDAGAVDVIVASNGAPFLLESRVGRGRALLLTSSPDPTWSTMFRSGIFPPLMVSSAAYLSGIGSVGESYQLLAGLPAELEFAGVPGEEPYEVRGEGGIVKPQVESTLSGFKMRIPARDAIGPYELWQGSRRIATLAVNVPAHESEILPMPDASFLQIIGGKPMSLAGRTSVQSAILEGRFGRELWKLCLVLALICLALEMIIGRVGKREIVAGS